MKYLYRCRWILTALHQDSILNELSSINYIIFVVVLIKKVWMKPDESVKICFSERNFLFDNFILFDCTYVFTGSFLQVVVYKRMEKQDIAKQNHQR